MWRECSPFLSEAWSEGAGGREKDRPRKKIANTHATFICERLPLPPRFKVGGGSDELHLDRSLPR
eukprot:8686349-Pyramimonas_sp.AAC.1